MRPEAENPRILIVDDDPDQRDLLETLLRRQGFRTRGAESGAAALDLLGREPYALMITDVRMPGMSGLEALRRVREQHPRLPVLLVTAFADVRSAVAAMRDGALNYLAKPIDLDELMASVRLAVQGGAPVPADVAVPPLPADVVVVSPLLRAVCLRLSWRPSCSGRSCPGAWCAPAGWSRPRPAAYFWTRSPSCRRRSRVGSCVC
jgi:DNA-binding response OmpR family regulator